MKLIFYISIILISSCFSEMNAQEPVLEEDISFSILKWFYDDYPKSTETSWVKNEAEGKTTYTVSFLFKEREHVVTYNLKGKREAELLTV
ncbi:MAG: hypothetical protein AAFY41_09125, partial [Bacteroidota bacterium]